MPYLLISPTMGTSVAPMTSTTRSLLAIERAHLAYAGRADDAAYIALLVAQTDAASAYEAATDGAFHHAYDADTADRMYYAARRAYDQASAALIGYGR